jgi:hypothetical protein
MEKNYEVLPANHMCQNSTSSIIVSTPGTSSNSASKNIDMVQQQHIENSKYDSVETVKPLYGGHLFTILFRNKTIYLVGKDEKTIIKSFLKNKKEYKKDQKIQIINNNLSTYIIKGNSKNKFIKSKKL